jgi:hypothetical protein
VGSAARHRHAHMLSPREARTFCPHLQLQPTLMHVSFRCSTHRCIGLCSRPVGGPLQGSRQQAVDTQLPRSHLDSQQLLQMIN